jgi:hypothetical protein
MVSIVVLYNRYVRSDVKSKQQNVSCGLATWRDRFIARVIRRLSSKWPEGGLNSKNTLLPFFLTQYHNMQEAGSSVSIVSCYGLDDRVIEVRSPAGAKDFSSNFCIQTGSGAHPASCTIGTGGPFPGTKTQPRRNADHSPPSSAEVENE